MIRIFHSGSEASLRFLARLKKAVRRLESESLERLQEYHKPQPEDFTYVEIPKESQGGERILRVLRKFPTLRWAVMDWYGSISDCAQLFHEGAFDYFGEEYAQEPPTVARIRRGLTWAGWDSQGDGQIEVMAESFDPATAKVGKTYRFLFLLVHIPLRDATRKRLGEKGLTQLRERFLQLLGQLAEEGQGVLWIQQELTFLLAYPPTQVRAALALGLRLVASRSLVSLEQLGLDFILDVRVNYDFGTASWQKPGETGQVIADAINFLFHLGIKRAPDNALTFSEESLESLPQRLRALLVREGDYEERNLFRTPVFEA